MSVMWGIEDGMTQSYAMTLCGFQFEDQTIPFGVYMIVQNFTSFLFYIAAAYLKDKFEY